jgi:predicted  nucleic acid-binding Zn-ribbon protein
MSTSTFPADIPTDAAEIQAWVATHRAAPVTAYADRVTHLEAVAERQADRIRVLSMELANMRERAQRAELEASNVSRKLLVAQADYRQMRDARDAAAVRIADLADERDGLTAQRDHAHRVVAKMRDISAHFAD